MPDGEHLWSGSRSGCSAYESAQAWQTQLADWPKTGCQAANQRGVADVAADADPATGAAVYALAGGVASTTPAASLPYRHPSQLHDVTTGSTGSCGTIMCQATTGYDGPTGLGTPKGIGGF